MSLFGNPASTGGGLFGQSASQQNNQQSGSLFGAQNTQQPAQNANPFGASTAQAAPSGGLFGSINAQPQQPGAGLFGSTTNQAGGGLFGQSSSTQQQPSSSLFGAPQQTQNTQQGGLFGQSQQQQQQPQQGLTFGQTQSSQPFGQSQQQSRYRPHDAPDASIPGQIERIKNKWDTGHTDCVFRHYFYNKVDENKAPYYRPSAREDDKSWQEALAAKPGPGYIPVICVGFAEMGERVKTQQRNLAIYNQRLHEINGSLEAMLNKHDTTTSVRALDARRRHTLLKSRAMKLASTVQILRNRGWALNPEEEELKVKLQALEKGVLDPGLNARSEEIWARMVGVRERARLLKDEMGKRAGAVGEVLTEEMARRAEKILEDYGKQLGHLKRELALVREDLEVWEKDNTNGR